MHRAWLSAPTHSPRLQAQLRFSRPFALLRAFRVKATHRPPPVNNISLKYTGLWYCILPELSYCVHERRIVSEHSQALQTGLNTDNCTLTTDDYIKTDQTNSFHAQPERGSF